jgi:hypothetical protein
MGDLWKRFRFTVLWILYLAGLIIYRTMASGENAYNVSLLNTNEFVPFFILLIVVIILSLMLKGQIFRSLTIIGGIIFLAVQIIMFVDGITSYPSSLFNIPTGLTIVVLAILTLLAFRLPKKTA